MDALELTDEVNALVYTIANSVVRRYSMIERADVVQEIYVWYFSHPRAVKRYLEDEDQKKGTRKLGRAMKNAAERYCREEKARIAGYHPSDEYFYDTGILRTMLPLAWADPEQLIIGSGQAEEGQPRRKVALNEGNNLQAMVADIKLGLERLPEHHYMVLERVYGDSLDYDELAQELETSKHAVEMRVSRALDALVDRLGGERPIHDGPGSRRAISNAQAIATTRHQDGNE